MILLIQLYMKAPLLKKSLQTLLIGLLLLCASGSLWAQNGTYEKKAPNGAYCYLSFQKNGNKVTAEIFAWWNTTSAQTGSYFGTGMLKGNTCVLTSDENDPSCKVTIQLVGSKLKATFDDCNTDHLPSDFNGLYTKITDATAGDYIVIAPKAYFHQKPNAKTQLKSYVVKGNRVTLNLDGVIAGNWVNVYYTGKNGKETSGYIELSLLRRYAPRNDE
jgi:hypothetical protein